jgi:hypothetical protein
MSGESQLTEIQKIAASCLEKWGEDVNTQNFSGKLGRFVGQLDTDDQLGNVILELIKHYNYYSRQKIEQIMIGFNDYIENTLKLDSDYTIYSRIEDDSKIDSSNTFLEEYKIINNISNHFSHDIEKLDIDDFNYINNIIFLDDIIGSGKTVKGFFEKNKDKLLKVQSYIFCVEILEDGRNTLESFFKDNNFKCIIIPHNTHVRAFSENHIFCENCQENELLMKEFEKKLWNKYDRFILGFENSQAVVSFFRNTPNNTISSFWYKNDKWQGLFPRDDRKPVFKRGKKSRVPYNLKIRENIARG